MPDLPMFESIRLSARNCLSDARDWLNSGWADEITEEQAEAFAEARYHNAQAKAALDRAARS